MFESEDSIQETQTSMKQTYIGYNRFISRKGGGGPTTF